MLQSWPLTLDTDDLPKKKLPGVYRAPTAEMLAYLDFSVSTTGMLAGIQMSHVSTTALCRAMKLQCELYPSRHVAVCLDPYCGLGFALWCLSSVYSGHHTILIPPAEVEANPAVWLTAVSQYKVRDTFCSYGESRKLLNLVTTDCQAYHRSESCIMDRKCRQVSHISFPACALTAAPLTELHCN